METSKVLKTALEALEKVKSLSDGGHIFLGALPAQDVTWAIRVIKEHTSNDVELSDASHPTKTGRS